MEEEGGIADCSGRTPMIVVWKTINVDADVISCLDAALLDWQ